MSVQQDSNMDPWHSSAPLVTVLSLSLLLRLLCEAKEDQRLLQLIRKRYSDFHEITLYNTMIENNDKFSSTLSNHQTSQLFWYWALLRNGIYDHNFVEAEM